jgi:hypothetical protein
MVNGVNTPPVSSAITTAPAANSATSTSSSVQQTNSAVAAGNATLSSMADLQTAMASVNSVDFFKANASLTQPPALSPPKTKGTTDPLMQEVEKMLNNPNVSAEDLDTLINGLVSKISDITLAIEASNIKNRSSDMKAAQDKRAQQIKDVADNVKSQKNLGFWGKFLNILSKIGSTLAAVATIALGSALAPFSGGVSLAIMAYGVYSLIGTLADTTNEIVKAAGGEGWNFSLTIGQAIGALATLAGASEDTVNWIKMGVDMAVDLAAAAVLMIVPGGQVKAAQLIKNSTTRLATEIEDATLKLTKFSEKMGRGVSRITTAGNITTNTTKLAQGGVQIAMADKAYDNAKIKAEMASLQQIVDFIQQLLQTAMDFMQNTMDNQAKVFEINASSIKVKAESRLMMANNGRANMA